MKRRRTSKEELIEDAQIRAWHEKYGEDTPYPGFATKPKTCVFPRCKKPAPIQSVITGEWYCSVEHRDEDRKRKGL